MAAAPDPKLLQYVLLPVAAGVGFCVLYFSIRKNRRVLEQREEIWRKFALDNRLTLAVEPELWWKFGSLAIRGLVGELSLELTTYRVRSGKQTQTWIKVHSRGDGPAGSFSIERENIPTRVGALVGMRDVPMGEDDFDGRFLVRSTPEALVREVFDAPLRAHFAGLTRSAKLSYAAGTCELVWHAGEESVEQLAAPVRLHAMLRGNFRRVPQTVLP